MYVTLRGSCGKAESAAFWRQWYWAATSSAQLSPNANLNMATDTMGQAVMKHAQTCWHDDDPCCACTQAQQHSSSQQKDHLRDTPTLTPAFSLRLRSGTSC